MELMTVKTLKDLVQESGIVSVSRAVPAILDVLDGLEEAHSHGMIHRDIKPANCYLESNGRVKLGDFGLARSIDDSSDLTRTGDFFGTPLFASPEQSEGARDRCAKRYLLHLRDTLLYLLAGQPLRGKLSNSVIAKIVSEDPTPFDNGIRRFPSSWNASSCVACSEIARPANKPSSNSRKLWNRLSPAEMPSLLGDVDLPPSAWIA